MLTNRPIYRLQRSWMALAVIILMITACNSTGLTKKQREAMEHHVDAVADAIKFSANKIKKSLFEYHNQKGAWPVQEQEQRAIFRDIDNVLEEHHIDGQKLLVVDRNEIIVEYYFSRKNMRQFPPLLESWVIIFSNKAARQLEVVAIYPNWRDPEKLAKETPYPANQISDLQKIFRQQLKDKLVNHQLQLSDNIDESV